MSLLGTWRAHGLDHALRAAWQAGVVMCGGSAGSLCWFSHAVSSFHEGPARMIEAMGLLPCSNAVHYDDEPGRREAFRKAVAGGMPAGYGAGDAVALHFVGTRARAGGELAAAVARAFHVSRDDRGAGVERDLPVRYLGR